MARAAVRFDQFSGQILGAVTVSQDADLELNVPPYPEVLREVPIDHPALTDQRNWSCPSGVLTYAPNPEPVREAQPKLGEFIEVLMDETNTLRQRAGLPPLTMTDITDKAKAKLRARV